VKAESVKKYFSQIYTSFKSIENTNPFIAINCGAIPEGTIDSELFGHEKGSFHRCSMINVKDILKLSMEEQYFLDEIGEMPIRNTSSRLLRVLESGEFIKVGSSTASQKTDVRVLAATNVNLLRISTKRKIQRRFIL
jgi:transcriptional regulator with PAS, ATPase and Fis domain